MKKYIKKIALATVGLTLLTACGEDYLQTMPQTSIPNEMASTDIKYIKMMVNGVRRTMTQQYLSSQGWNGIGTSFLNLKSDPSGFIIHSNGTTWVINGTNNDNANNSYGQYIYGILYRMILNANNTLETIEMFEPKNAVEENTIKLYKAQVLTLRSYFYGELMPMFSKRWTDSRNGESRGLVLRLDTSAGSLRASSQNEVCDQLYSDLNEAIRLFNECGINREVKYHEDASVAHAVFARLAMWKNDWQTAITHAQAARKGYDLMGTDLYYAGFCEPNKEWIYQLYNSTDENLYYYGYFAYAGANSSSSACRTNPYLIDKILLNSIPETDSRKPLYIAPTDEEWGEMNGDSPRINRTTLQATAGKFYTRVRNEYSNRLYSTSNVYAYMQTKIQVLDQPGVGHLCLFRAAEMLYDEAEANYRLNNTSAAQTALETAVKPYDSDYTCNLSGEDLLKEIKKYRLFDMFLEGQTYVDQKRWGDSRVRVSISNGGNWRETWAGTVGPTEMNNWCWCFGRTEVNYNDEINSNIESPNWSKDDPSTW